MNHSTETSGCTYICSGTLACLFSPFMPFGSPLSFLTWKKGLAGVRGVASPATSAIISTMIMTFGQPGTFPPCKLPRARTRLQIHMIHKLRHKMSGVAFGTVSPEEGRRLTPRMELFANEGEAARVVAIFSRTQSLQASPWQILQFVYD